MNEMIKLTDSVCEAEQVFLPNRYQKSFVNAYEALTRKEVPEMDGRKLTVRSNGVTYCWSRGRDIPRILDAILKQKLEKKSIGFTGSEWWSEFSYLQRDRSVDFRRLAGDSLGSVALIASRESDVLNIREMLIGDAEPVSVVTAYPNVVRGLSERGRYNIAVQLAVAGCAEGVACALGVPAVDLVSTGETIEENGFLVVEKIFDSYPGLISAVSNTQNKVCPSAGAEEIK